MYGGAAGPGKSDALLMGALQYVDQPGYNALLLRRTVPQLTQAGGLIHRSFEWLKGTDAEWNGTYHRWTFPSGSRLQFSHLLHEETKYDFQSSEYQFIGFDELTQFTETQYTYLFSRLRRRSGVLIPLRMRSATNPGGLGHEWVKKRFQPDRVGSCPGGRVFIPARLADNPYIDQESYLESLSHLTGADKERLIRGDWTVTDGGQLFSRSWFRTILPYAPPKHEVMETVRAWDLAATVGPDSKRTAGVKMSRRWDGLYVVEHVVMGKWRPGERDTVVEQTARADGRWVTGDIEEEGGSGGIAQNEALIKRLAGYPYHSQRISGDKERRAGPFAAQAQIGNVALVEGPWIEEYLDELDLFPEGQYADQVDASSLAFNRLSAIQRTPDPPKEPLPQCACGGDVSHASWCPLDTSHRERTPLDDLQSGDLPR